MCESFVLSLSPLVVRGDFVIGRFVLFRVTGLAILDVIDLQYVM
jgi:hypothetical protein